MDRTVRQNLKSVIMAGGSGTRFWPRSRRLFPKQFLKILSDKSMLQVTIDRLLPLTPMDAIYIVGNRNHKPLFEQQVPACRDHRLILEPVGKNTAACIATIAFIIARNNPDSVLMILPADHWITNPAKFRETLGHAATAAFCDDAIVTLGIPPTFPSTGYGYIKIPEGSRGNGNPEAVHRVEAFVEKPDLERAKTYLASGNFFWNSGIFVTKASVILDEIARFLPDLYRPLEKLREIDTEDIPAFLDAAYPSLPSISIDYGVMEKTDRTMMIEADFGWSDVGSWDALYDLSPKDPEGNVSEGRVLMENCQGCMLSSHGRLIAGVGLKDIVIIDSPDATLILPRGKSQDVRKIVSRLEEKGMEDLL